jgi:serine/threonine protein kinase
MESSYRPQGSFLLAEKLTPTPFGNIHRALMTSGDQFRSHHLLCLFSNELVGAGLAARWAEAQQIAKLLKGDRSFGANYQLENDQPSHLACDYTPGRSLAQVLEKARTEQIPFTMDQVLTVLQELGHGIGKMHQKGLHHGILSPHSVWISFEGAAQIMDAPIAAIIQTLLPRTPALKAALAPYAMPGPGTELQRDLYALGSILYEMLTLEPLPGPAAASDTLGGTGPWEEPIPSAVLAILERLLMVNDPFTTAEEFNETLERLIYDDDFSATTFNIAFSMHSLFREENRTDIQAMQRDQTENYSSFLPVGMAAADRDRAEGRHRKAFLLLGGIGASAALLVFAGMIVYIHSGNRRLLLEQKSMQNKIAEYQKENAASQARLEDITRREGTQKTLVAALGQQAQAGASGAVLKSLAEAKQKARELSEQRAEAVYAMRLLESRKMAGIKQ